AAQSNPFTYRLSGLGTFGPAHYPRVLWMGVSEPSGTLDSVQRALNLALEQQGFTTEKRPFSPHLTLARIKTSLNPEHLQILQQLLSHSQFASPDYRVTHLYVMESELVPSGARYSCLRVCPFQKQ
ncbi:MAG: RNA 2',3'-cyclic phosphodiesterase, partial [Ktedonobacteraceae bacterium]